MAIVANRYWVLLALLAGAVASYSIGFMAGLGLFLAAGALLELAFWVMFFTRKRRR
jgi:hypothetical protein